MGEWIGLVGVLLGVTVTGFMNYLLAGQQHKNERSSEDRRRFIENCESIHGLLSDVHDYASQLNMAVIGDIGFSTKIKADNLPGRVQLERLSMLVDFYAPTLQADVQKISDKFVVIGRAAVDTIGQKNRTDEWKAKTVETSTTATIELGKIIKEAKGRLGSLARSKLSDGIEKE